MTAPFDGRAFRGALGAFATGVTIVTTCDGEGRDVGLTANSFNSVSLDPPMILWSLAKSSASLDTFKAASHFVVHVLGAEQEALSTRFASKGADKFAGMDISRNAAGMPLLPDCAARFQCRVAYQYEGGDHVIFVGEVDHFDHGEVAPLLFHAGRYALAQQKLPDVGDEVQLEGAGTGHLITRIFHQLVTPLRIGAAKLGLSVAQRYMMNLLLAEPDQGIDDINAIIAYSGQAIDEPSAQALVECGLASCSGSPARYSLTAEGRECVIGLLAAGKAVEADALANLNETEQRQLHSFLSRMASALAGRGDEAMLGHVGRVQDAIGRSGQA